MPVDSLDMPVHVKRNFVQAKPYIDPVCETDEKRHCSGFSRDGGWSWCFLPTLPVW